MSVQMEQISENSGGDSNPSGSDSNSNSNSDSTSQPNSQPNSDSGSDDKKLRLSKLMSLRGICSRREADEFIAKGLVRVDGQVVNELGFKVLPTAKVELLSMAHRRQEEKVTILLNKPIGYVSAQPEPPYLPSVRLITPENQDAQDKTHRLSPRHFKGLAVAGRLDIDSQGLLVFTQDGRVAKTLIGPESVVEKEYLVRVEGHLPAEKLQLLRHGLELDGEALKPAKVDWVNEDQLKFILTEGKKRQVRRMCEMVGLRVRGLKRVRVGKVMLGSLKEGQWRYLKPDESFD
jgi:23S rRNA pseudouridine2604 synthase